MLRITRSAVPSGLGLPLMPMMCAHIAVLPCRS